MNLDKLFLYGDKVNKYFVFKVIKGNCERAAEIFDENELIGRVIRSGYKYNKGMVCGLGYFTKEVKVEDKEQIFYVKNLHQENFYEIKIVKFL